MSRTHSVGYFSSYDRGLACLLDVWPQIREQVPDATLAIYYGWATFDAAHHGNPTMMQWRWKLTRQLYDLKDQGVSEHGRVSHTELAEAMKRTKVWAYPTEFTEINCMTALKAEAAGMIPVVNKVYALKETVGTLKDKPGRLLHLEDSSIYTSQPAQHTFIKLVVMALTDKLNYEPTNHDVSWPTIAKQWREVMSIGDRTQSRSNQAAG